jgi:hypothetical protein
VGRGLYCRTLIFITDILTASQLVEVVTWNQLGIHIKRKAEHSSPFRFCTHTYRSDCRTQRSGVLQPSSDALAAWRAPAVHTFNLDWTVRAPAPNGAPRTGTPLQAA